MAGEQLVQCLSLLYSTRKSVKYKSFCFFVFFELMANHSNDHFVRNKLARTSAAPGKTRLANFYKVAADPRPPFYLVDLPGFGYARGGDKAREEFDALAAEYFGSRLEDPRFRGVLVLVDSRHPGLEADRQTWNWLSRVGVARHAVATKVDKLTQSERRRHLVELERLYSGPVTPVSAETGEGLDALWKKIASLTTTARP